MWIIHLASLINKAKKKKKQFKIIFCTINSKSSTVVSIIDENLGSLLLYLDITFSFHVAQEKTAKNVQVEHSSRIKNIYNLEIKSLNSIGECV